MNKILEKNNDIHYQSYLVLWKNKALEEKWLDIIDRNSGTIFWPNFRIDVYKDPPLTEATFGTIHKDGKCWIPGSTYQVQRLRVLEIDNTGRWTDVKILHTSKIYTIKVSMSDDCANNLIPTGDVGLPIVLRNETFSDVYEALKETSEGLTITEIGNITGLSRNTVFRVCKDFVFNQWIRREKDKSYTVICPEVFGWYAFEKWKYD